MTAFTLFGDLPAEIRLRIWWFSLPRPNCIEPYERYSEKTYGLINKLTKNPPTLYINQESRLFTMEHYQTWERPPKTGWQYIDFTIDTIRLPIGVIWAFILPCAGRIDILSSKDLQQIQNLELTSVVASIEVQMCDMFLETAMVSTLLSLRRMTLHLLSDENDNPIARVRIAYMNSVKSIETMIKSALRRLYEQRKGEDSGRSIVLRIELPDGTMVETVEIGSSSFSEVRLQ